MEPEYDSDNDLQYDVKIVLCTDYDFLESEAVEAITQALRSNPKMWEVLYDDPDQIAEIVAQTAD